MLDRIEVTHAGLAVMVVLALAGTGFAVSPAPEESFAPVQFDRTLKTGMTGLDVQQAEAMDWSVPRGQVFYSQYQYVVGYYGMDALVEAVGEPDTSAYGRPLAIFVTDYSGTDPRLTAEGYVVLRNAPAEEWTRASGAHFVVGSRARTPGGGATLPFGERADAVAFAREYGGTVVDWERLPSRVGEPRSRGGLLRQNVHEQRAWANRTVERSEELVDRPVSVVVGEDVPTLAAAVDRAPPNTTIRLPAGTYAANLTVSKPVTLAGAGNATVLDGGGTGSVLTLRAPRAAVTNLRIAGVGDRNVGEFAGESAGSAWDRRIRLVYGRGDAAIRLADAPGSFVGRVTIETPSNGVVLLDSSRTVIANVTVRGAETPTEGFMGVLSMYSRVVIQDSTFRGGRDGVYTHYANDLVVRRNDLRDMRYGVHLMYTSGALVADNAARDLDAGIIMMTRPTGDLFVGNDVRRAEVGLALVGSTSLVAENVLANNGIGLSVGTDRSLITHNTVVDNEVGVRDDTLLPTNDVLANDVVANDRPVDPGPGARDVWAADGRGNYWGPVPGRDRDGDGVVDRPYRPTAAADGAAGRSAGAAVLARSPAVSTMRAFQRTVPGLRRGGVVDPHPLARPVRPDVLDRLGAGRSDRRVTDGVETAGRTDA